MPEPDPLRIMTFVTPKDLGQWLKENHASENELWVKIFKKSSHSDISHLAFLLHKSLC